MSAATLTKKMFYSGVLEICCQVCHTANQLRHLFLDPLQRRSAFGILANSDFSSQNGEKKTRKLSRFKYFHFPSTFPLLIFKETKNFNQKDILPPLTPPWPPSQPFRWFYFPPALVLQVAVPWELPVGPLGVRHCPASHPPQGCQSFAPWTHRLRKSVTTNHPPRGCF